MTERRQSFSVIDEMMQLHWYEHGVLKLKTECALQSQFGSIDSCVWSCQKQTERSAAELQVQKLFKQPRKKDKNDKADV